MTARVFASVRLAAVLLVAVLLAGALALPAVAVTPPYTNRLIHSADPYLLEHAHNPVDWYPWGPEALAKAKAESKPIFLSIGYSTCYWCHVAEREIYSDPAIAALMNQWFVNVKVDREERPDVDRLFIIATEMLTQHGAWPNNLFLTPDGRPFYAGSYFPPKDDGDQPGFPKVLAAIHDLWVNHRAEQVEPAANELMAALRKVEAKADTGQTVGAQPTPVAPRIWLKAATQSLLDSVDPVNGGFGRPKGGPKFPQAPALALLAAAARLDGNAAAASALATTLQAMALGGIHDQLAGGFGRYATEPTWTIPHFEKMLSDNAQLLDLYAAAYQRTKDPLDREVARGTAAYLLRDMALPGGGFATAQDAATNGVEGATYLWTRAEIEAVLGPADTERFLAGYEVAAMPEAGARPASGPSAPPPGVLRVRLPLTETLRRAGTGNAAELFRAFAPMRAKLLAARDRRPQPMRDDKLVVGLNGLAITALTRADASLADSALTAAAVKAAERILALAFDPATGALRHQIFGGTAAGDGFLDDYALFGDGLLTLAETTGDAVWRARAIAVANAMLDRFLRPNGALAAAIGGETLLPVTLEDGEDADAPSGTSAALDLLSRLGGDPGGERFAEAAARAAACLASRVAAHPTMWPSAVVALAEHPPSPVVAAKPASTQPAAARAEPARFGVPSTADHVHASAAVMPGDAGKTVRVTLTVDPGYHINAHVPSLDYLVPTDLAFAGVAPSTVAYPKAVSFKPGFVWAPLDVYEGSVVIVAALPKAASSWTASVAAQACDAKTCLPPATISVPVDQAGR